MDTWEFLNGVYEPLLQRTRMEYSRRTVSSWMAATISSNICRLSRL